MATLPNCGGKNWPARWAITGSHPRISIVFEDASPLAQEPLPADAISPIMRSRESPMPADVANTARRVHREAVVSKLTPRVGMRRVQLCEP